jgi:branched-chain amino acid transport system permease protein
LSVSFLLGVLASTAILVAFATAVVLVYRASHVLAFHVGEIGVMAAYVAVAANKMVPAGPWASVITIACGLIAALAMGAITHLVVDRWGGRRGHFVGTVLTIALGIVILGLVSLVWSGESKRLVLATGRLEFGDFGIAWNTGASALICMAGVVLVQIVVRFTRFGIDMRAVANNPRLAELRGVPVRRVLLVTWLMASVMAGLGGIGVAAISSAAMEGAFVGISGVVAAILGGMTSLVGALVGAILIAAAEHGVTVFVDARYSQVVPVVMLLIVLALRPSGLAGRVERIARV